MAEFSVKYAAKFKKDLKRLKNDEQTVRKVKEAVKKIAAGERLPFRFHDYALKGEFAGLRELHVCPDLLLVYKKQDDVLILTCLRIASLADIFGK